MKKRIFTLLLLCPAFAFAQTNTEHSKKSQASQVPVKIDQKTIDQVEHPINKPADAPAKSNEGTFKTRPYDFPIVGKTYYDLQTNAAVGRRIVLHSDGTVSMVWTHSRNDLSGFPERGTGYNHNDNGTWVNAPDANKVETADRTGWPSIGVLANGDEFVIGHVSDGGGYVVSKNDGKGSNNFSKVGFVLDDGDVPIWCRAASNGNTIHLIGGYSSNEDQGIPEAIRDGIINPVTYSRSIDGGANWEVERILLPGYDTSRYVRGSADNYAIDVKGDVVAIVMGGLSQDVALWKSTDAGQNWTKSYVDSFAYAPYNYKQIMPDTPYTNDGSLDLVIDDNNDVHVVFGLSRVLDTDTTDESQSFYPGTSQMMYWKEGMDEPVGIGGLVDMDGDGQFTISAETFAGLDANGNPSNGAAFAGRYGNLSLVTHPSIALDDNGNIFVTYDAPVESPFGEYLHTFNANFRDIFVVSSDDGGSSWTDPQNLTQLRRFEAVFGCVAKRTDDFLHMVFQVDETPGTNLQSNGNTGLHPIVENNIHYAAIPTSAILNEEIGQHTLNVRPVEKGNRVFVVNQNYPNPFSGTTDVTVYLENSTEVTLKVTDLTGKTVINQNLGNMNAGNHELQIDGSNLSSGMYLYTISTATNSITKRMQVR